MSCITRCLALPNEDIMNRFVNIELACCLLVDCTSIEAVAFSVSPQINLFLFWN